MYPIRPALPGDIPAILRIYESARAFMRAHGNASQWAGGYPSRATVEEDIRRGECFVMTDGTDAPRAVFAFILGADPTYAVIEGGAWRNDEPYGTIHRIAGDGSVRGVVRRALAFCLQQAGNVRADTHADNLPMQQALLGCGFAYCGVIHLEDGSPRLAYHYVSSTAE